MPPIQHLMCPSLTAWKGRATVTGSSSMVTKRDLAACPSLLPKLILQFHHSTPESQRWLLAYYALAEFLTLYSNSQQITTWFASCTLQPKREPSLHVGSRFNIVQHMARWLQPCNQMAGMIILGKTRHVQHFHLFHSLPSTEFTAFDFEFHPEGWPLQRRVDVCRLPKSPRCSRGIRRLARSSLRLKAFRSKIKQPTKRK